jgi:hypothetical protein
MLLLLHPEVAGRECRDCQKHVYDEKTGQRGSHNGQPIKRPPRAPPPCARGLCPKGKPEDHSDLTLRNWQAYRHYLRCRAVSRFPDDPLVEHHAAIIRAVEDIAERRERSELRQLLLMRAVR